MVKVRYFYNDFNCTIIEAVQNPCGCCPYSLTVTWGKRFNDAYSIFFKNQNDLDTHLYYKRHWVEL